MDCKKDKAVNPFVANLIDNYCAEHLTGNDTNARFDCLCHELSKIIGKKRGKIYSATINNNEFAYSTSGTISNQFKRINNESTTYTENVENRNKLFVYALSKWLKYKRVDLPILRDINDDDVRFEILWQKIFEKKRTAVYDAVLGKLLKSPGDAASFIFPYYIKNPLSEIKSSEFDENKTLKLAEIKSNISQDILWKNLFKSPIHSLNQAAIGEKAIDLIQESVKQPLFQLLLNKWAHYKSKCENIEKKLATSYETDLQKQEDRYIKRCSEYHKAYLILLRSSFGSSLDGESTPKVMPAVASLNKFIYKTLEKICSNTEYTVRDIIKAYGDLASTVDGQYRFNKDNIDELNASDDLKNDIKNIQNGHEIIIRKSTSSLTGYTFEIKLYRIFFRAVCDAIQLNSDSSVDYPTMFRNVFKLCKIILKKSDLVNLERSSLEDIIIYSAVLIKHLDEKIRTGFIKYLIKESTNYTVAYRSKQILAIYILTIVLSENSDLLTSDLRDKIYSVTYATSAYKLLTMQLETLKEQSKYLENEITRKITENFNQTELISEYQPFYFFYYDIPFSSNSDKISQYFSSSASDVKQFCHDAFLLRKSTWDRNESSDSIGKIKELISRGIEIKKTFNITEKGPFVTRMFSYAINALMYAITNILNYDNTHKDSLRSYLNSIMSENTIFLDLIFFSDSTVRKSNKTYMERSNLQNNENMYILCGAYRLFCAIGHCPSTIKYELDSEMLSTYEFVFYKGKGRYLLLMSYMLSFTNFFESYPKLLSYLESEISDLSVEFLSYDHLNMDNIRKYPKEIEKWQKPNH